MVRYTLYSASNLSPRVHALLLVSQSLLSRAGNATVMKTGLKYANECSSLSIVLKGHLLRHVRHLNRHLLHPAPESLKFWTNVVRILFEIRCFGTR